MRNLSPGISDCMHVTSFTWIGHGTLLFHTVIIYDHVRAEDFVLITPPSRLELYIFLLTTARAASFLDRNRRPFSFATKGKSENEGREKRGERKKGRKEKNRRKKNRSRRNTSAHRLARSRKSQQDICTNSFSRKTSLRANARTRVRQCGDTNAQPRHSPPGCAYLMARAHPRLVLCHWQRRRRPRFA